MKQVILHDIRSNYNVGAIFRTADATAVSKIYLTGYTPAPQDRFGREVAEISKTALGAENFVSWEQVEDILSLLEKLKNAGSKIVAIEQSENSVSLYDFKVPDNVVYILGSETAGLSKEIISAADMVVEIPMSGRKESLNVSVTAGVVLYHI